MRNKILLSLLFMSIGISAAFSQAADCSNATPFCTGTDYSFPAATNTQAPVGPDYDCLFTQPNPAFYFLQIDQPGNIDISIQGIFGPPGTVPIPGINTNDIDFICWGPFIDSTMMCDSLTTPYVVDCSYSPTWDELCEIPNAQYDICI